MPEPPTRRGETDALEGGAERHAVRYESRDELERGVGEMRSRGWALWRVVGVPQDALIATFIRRAPSCAPGRAEEADRGGEREDY